MATLDSSDS